MESLESRIQQALGAAAAARDSAYVPYSHFAMGAAVVTESGHVIKGALVENVSLGLAMCAERVALFASVVNADEPPQVLALHSKRTAGELTWPCGACLQVAMELGGPKLIVAVSDGDVFESAELGELAPRLPHKNRD